jgi:hypothetical protein
MQALGCNSLLQMYCMVLRLPECVISILQVTYDRMRAIGKLMAVFERKKIKLSLYLSNQALRHKGLWGSGCTETHFLDLGTSWR